MYEIGYYQDGSWFTVVSRHFSRLGNIPGNLIARYVSRNADVYREVPVHARALRGIAARINTGWQW